DFRLDVPGHGDIDEKERLVLAQFHEGLELGAVENVVRRGSAADDDVNPAKFAGPFVEVHGASAQLAGQREGAFVGTVGNDDALGSAREKGARGFFTGFTGSD